MPTKINLVVGELLLVWPLLRGCAHDFDPECARCRWLGPLTAAIRALDEDS